MEQENQRKFLVFRIIAFERCQKILIFSNRMLVIESQYVTKQH